MQFMNDAARLLKTGSGVVVSSIVSATKADLKRNTATWQPLFEAHMQLSATARCFTSQWDSLL